jgi:Holliday junction resolvase RusA-like endonuclease
MRHWRLTQQQKDQARKAVEEQDLGRPLWPSVDVSITFYHAQKRRRDGSNFAASLKGAFDGIVESGLVVDDDSEHWTTLPPVFRIDKEFPRTEIVIAKKKTVGC